jgi:hypothetical protein
MLPDLEDPDWEEAFWFASRPQVACMHVTGHADLEHPCVRGIATASFEREDVARAIALCAGRPHHAPWLGVFELRDGRFAVLRASCCNNGWACHREGRADVARSLEDLARYALTAAERERAGL